MAQKHYLSQILLEQKMGKLSNNCLTETLVEALEGINPVTSAITLLHIA